MEEQTEEEPSHTAGALCSLCERPLRDGDADDAACRRCSDESIDNVLAPFLLIRRYRDARDLEREDSAKRNFPQRSESRNWKSLLNAARKKWHPFETESDHVVIAVRIHEWLDEETRSRLELQRPLLPAATVLELLGEISPELADAGCSDEELSSNAPEAVKNWRNDLHQRDDEPPKEFRREGKDDGEPIGPITGSMEALGFARRRGSRGKASKEANRKQIRRDVAAGNIWLRKTCEGLNKKHFDMFVKTLPERNRCEDEMAIFLQHNQTQPDTTKDN
jgi:hypothetical protein